MGLTSKLTIPMQREKSVNMANKEEKVDDSIGNYIWNGLAQNVLLFLQRDHKCIVSITILKQKIRQLHNSNLLLIRTRTRARISSIR